MQRELVEFIGSQKASCSRCNLPPAPGGVRFPTIAGTFLAPVRRHSDFNRVYAKIYEQIFDSSIAENYQVRHVFEDLLKLADQDGVVDRTREAIARRTNVPLEIVTMAIAELEKPDKRSRSRDNEGRRIVRLEERRDWGWRIVNHGYYRKLKNADEMRLAAKERQRNYRLENKKNEKNEQSVTKRDLCILHTSSVSDSSSLVLSSSCELPPWYPQSEQEAIAACMASGIEEAFIRQTWNKGAGRGGLDSKSCQIRRFANHVKTEWNYELARRSREPKKMPPRETPYYPGCDPNQRNHV